MQGERLLGHASSSQKSSPGISSSPSGITPNLDGLGKQHITFAKTKPKKLYGEENIPEHWQAQFTALRESWLKTGKAWPIKETPSVAILVDRLRTKKIK